MLQSVAPGVGHIVTGLFGEDRDIPDPDIVYVQGGVGVSTQAADTTTAEQEASGGNPLDFLIELYFPHNIVGAGRFAQETWGLDVTWEP